MNTDPQRTAPNEQEGVFARLRYFLTPVDGRYEDLKKGSVWANVARDFSAGLVVAMVAIPLAMGFAMASGLRPEQGIVGGAVAGLVGALFGGSKYQVYGPTAAFIPIIAAMVAAHGYPFLVLVSVLSGLVLMAMGVAGIGRLAQKVPQSVVVGFTIGIAVVIGTSQLGEALGLKAALGYSLLDKIGGLAQHINEVNFYAIALALLTFLITKYMLKVSPFVPAPLLALGVTTLISATIWSGKGLTLVKDKYGSIPTDFFVFTPPQAIPMTASIILDLAYYVIAVVFVAAIESLLCSRMADRLANNQGKPYHPNKELWGQGMVNLIIPLFNGFPHTGALARTATNIKVGALSPLAGIFKFALKLILAAFLAHYLELVPMASIAGILLFVAQGMVKPAEIKEAAINRLEIGVIVFTAVMVPLTDFLTGVLAALGLHAVLSLVLKKRAEEPASEAVEPFSQTAQEGD